MRVRPPPEGRVQCLRQGDDDELDGQMGSINKGLLCTEQVVKNIGLGALGPQGTNLEILRETIQAVKIKTCRLISLVFANN